MTTTNANGTLTGDLGASPEPIVLVPDGSYHIADITFAISAGAPPGIYTLRTTTLYPRPSIQTTSDFHDAPFPAASFTIIRGIPEPSVLSMLIFPTLGFSVLTLRRRRNGEIRINDRTGKQLSDLGR